MSFDSHMSKPICEVFGEIPVSPILKKRVRQRLFSLVNNIDGYIPNIDKNLEDGLTCICKEKKIRDTYYEEHNYKMDKEFPPADVCQNKDCSSNYSDQNFKQYINEVLELLASLNSKLASLENDFHLANEKHEREFEFLRSLFTFQNLTKQSAVLLNESDEIPLNAVTASLAKDSRTFLKDGKISVRVQHPTVVDHSKIDVKEVEKDEIDQIKWNIKNSVQNIKLRQIQEKLNILREKIEILRIQNIEFRLLRKALKIDKREIKSSKNIFLKEKTDSPTYINGSSQKNNVRKNLSVISRDEDEAFVKEYKDFIVAQLVEYKKVLRYLKKKCKCIENI